MIKTDIGKITMDELLKLYDWHIRFTGDGNREDADDYYMYGYADGIGQCILAVGKALGETADKPYKYEAFKRCMEYDTTKNYWKKYPTPLSDYFPPETIRENGGKS